MADARLMPLSLWWWWTSPPAPLLRTDGKYMRGQRAGVVALPSPGRGGWPEDYRPGEVRPHHLRRRIGGAVQRTKAANRGIEPRLQRRLKLAHVLQIMIGPLDDVFAGGDTPVGGMLAVMG